MYLLIDTPYIFLNNSHQGCVIWYCSHLRNFVRLLFLFQNLWQQRSDLQRVGQNTLKNELKVTAVTYKFSKMKLLNVWYITKEGNYERDKYIDNVKSKLK